MRDVEAGGRAGRARGADGRAREREGGREGGRPTLFTFATFSVRSPRSLDRAAFARRRYSIGLFPQWLHPPSSYSSFFSYDRDRAKAPSRALQIALAWKLEVGTSEREIVKRRRRTNERTNGGFFSLRSSLSFCVTTQLLCYALAIALEAAAAAATAAASSAS